MNERLIHLRIKIKSLAMEAMAIRAEARKTSGITKWNLNHHRTSVVREHARLNLLAYGLLRGVPYKTMEQKCYERPSFTEVSKIAKRFGGEEEQIQLWIEEAKKYLAGK